MNTGEIGAVKEVGSIMRGITRSIMLLNRWIIIHTQATKADVNMPLEMDS